jgi:hypothetical protein
MDMHVPVVANARIVDVIMTSSPDEEVRIDGLTPIKVPDGVRVVNPTSLNDILTQKYAGILAMYPGFSNIVYDDLLDSAGLESPNLGLDLQKRGARGTVGGRVRTLLSDPNLDVSPTVLTQGIVVYETYSVRYVDPKDGRFERYYIEVPETLHTLEASANGGTSLFTTTSGSLVEFPPGHQGSIVQIDFGSEFVNNRLLHLGSWALVY